MTRHAGLRGDRRVAWLMLAPAIAVIALIALFPLGWTGWESLHRHDLRMPWLGEPFVGLHNYARIAHDPRFWSALGHTAFFTVATVSLELVLGLALALGLHRSFRGRGLVRALVLVPWAIPTVVAALLWRFLFSAPGGAVNDVLLHLGLRTHPVVWLVHAGTAWIPVILADVWKTTPFVTLLLLAGLQQIDPVLYESAAVDGAGAWTRLWRITIPLLQPAIALVLVYRTLDAVRVFDLIYVLTNGGPGTATEPIALYTFTAMMQDLRFGYGAALSVVVFAITLGLALLYLRALGRGLVSERTP